MNKTLRIGAIVLLVCAVSGGLIYGAWWLEEYSKQIRTVVVEQPDGHIFAVEMDEKEGGTVFIQCDEEEFEEAFAKFRRFLNVDDAPLSIPGGPMGVAHIPAEVPSDLEPAKRALVEVLKRHSPKRVVLLAHSDCLLYDTVAAWNNQLDAVKERQSEDLKRAVRTLKQWLPKSEVQVYYARRENNQLRFMQVDPKDLAVQIGAGPRIVNPEAQQPDTSKGR